MVVRGIRLGKQNGGRIGCDTANSRDTIITGFVIVYHERGPKDSIR